MIDKYMYIRSDEERLEDCPPLDFKGKVIVWIGMILSIVIAIFIINKWF